MDEVVALAPTSGLTVGACAALNMSRASVYRWRADLVRPRVEHRPRWRRVWIHAGPDCP